MTNSIKSESRILAHQAAHELNREEIDAVAGGTDCTFTFCFGTHIDDASGDCDIP